MYSTVLNTAYLFHIVDMMSVVTNRLCSDFGSQGVHHCVLARAVLNGCSMLLLVLSHSTWYQDSSRVFQTKEG